MSHFFWQGRGPSKLRLTQPSRFSAGSYLLRLICAIIVKTNCCYAGEDSLTLGWIMAVCPALAADHLGAPMQVPERYGACSLLPASLTLLPNSPEIASLHSLTSLGTLNHWRGPPVHGNCSSLDQMDLCCWPSWSCLRLVVSESREMGPRPPMTGSEQT